jgi:hypothetical protein
MRGVVGLLVVVGVLSVGAGPVLGVSRAPAPQIVLALPPPGHVTLAAIRLRVTGKQVAKLPARVAFRLSGRKALPAGATVLAASQTQRAPGSATYTMLFALVNAAPRALRSTASSNDQIVLPQPIGATPFLVASGGSFRWLVRMDPQSDAIPARYLFSRGHEFEPSAQIPLGDGSGISQGVLLKWTHAFAADLGAASQRAQAAHAVGDLLAPPAQSGAAGFLSGSNISFGVYSDGHPLGSDFNTPLAKAVTRDAWSLLTAPQQGLDGIVQEIEAGLASGATAPPPPPPANQQFFTYAFNDLQIAFDGPNVPDVGRSHVTVNFQGAGCGTPTVSNWKGTYQVISLGAPLNLAWNTGFTAGKSVLVYSWSSRQGGPTGPILGQVQISLIFLAGSPAKVGIRWSSTGDIANVTVGQDTPVTATPAASC